MSTIDNRMVTLGLPEAVPSDETELAGSVGSR